MPVQWHQRCQCHSNCINKRNASFCQENCAFMPAWPNTSSNVNPPQTNSTCSLSKFSLRPRLAAHSLCPSYFQQGSPQGVRRQQHGRHCLLVHPIGSSIITARPVITSAPLFLPIVRKGGSKPWSRLFQNLRASEETELFAEYLLERAREWIGNTPENEVPYLNEPGKAHFQRPAGVQKGPIAPAYKAMRVPTRTGVNSGVFEGIGESEKAGETLKNIEFAGVSTP
jgi:hypothetical protein